jgi:hypothetical protein
MSWDGKGLPPVGAECETKIGNFWKKCEIVAHVNDYGEARAIYQMDNTWGHSSAPIFRPIKSNRDKAIEDMINILDEDVMHTKKDVFGAIYDAGYRKVVKDE